ncbi:hypothetical protein B0H13DRAFT_2374519 [Mycena leptocephala]|nr:hypothetical protein B0H13DRAFT_2374519 [Mycena leptocephala]
MSAPPLTCTPVFLPDPGHEDEVQHSASKDTWFYGVITKDWQGIVTSMATSRTWDGIGGCGMRIVSKSTSTKEGPRCRWWTLRLTPPCRALHRVRLRRPKPRVARASPTKGTRRAPSPIKPGPSTGQKVGVRFSIPPFHAANHHAPCQVATIGPLNSVHDTAAIAAKFEAWSSDKGADERSLMFGVSGTNRIFRDRYRALAAFLETPGAELFYTYDEDAVLEFIEKEAAQMLKRKEAA